MVDVFIPSSIRDKATRDALNNIVNNMGGSASITVKDLDPNPNDTGSIGDIIYAHDSDSIWIFTGTIWEKSKVSESHSIGITATTPGTVDSDPSGWATTATNFRNNTGTVKALVATLYIDGVPQTSAAHNTYNYIWRKNGLANFSSTTTQRSDTGQTARSLLVDATDIADKGEDAFTCELTYP